MDVYLNNQAIDELTQEILFDYIQKENASRKYVNIEGLAKYFQLDVRYEQISEKENAIGFLALEDSHLQIVCDGKEVTKIIPKNQIILDISLAMPEMRNRLRFTLAHEIGHYLETRFCSVGKLDGEYRKSANSQRQISIEEYYQLMNAKEMQANRFAAALLMPEFMLKAALNEINNGKKIVVYGEYVFLPSEKAKMNILQQRLGVGFDTLRIRMKQLHLLENRTMGTLVTCMKGDKRI